MTPPPPLPTVGAALDWALRELHQTESGPLLAQVLLGSLLKRSRSWIIAHPEQALPFQPASAYPSLVKRARGGEPLPYLTGIQEFFGLEFEVTPDVLIPRPETELLVSTALDWLAGRMRDAGRTAALIRAVDLGTGSGCIAAALTVHTAGLRMIASDVSSRALAVAARNFHRHGVHDRIHLVQADLLTALRGQIDLLCANLPYALTHSLEGSPVVRFEPRLAIDGGPDGLRLVARAIDQSAGRMAADGLALFEIDAAHANEARKLARRLFPKAAVSMAQDLAGLNRLLVIQS
ncbi:MAG: peptide chain release factor N(5)-glutamine methyltransferase [Anaerolineales bacterium]|nr:peptide chain release factor N(5)-glutamine methyltransferase [Anaerolineales bacterium]